ncbi:carboxypeptidase-like regulatory domain-containing protein [Pedobacter africanus]|uniref:Carboxypeptidase regulatory-like domain-containing protein n=1 Tax=Pedobacter africanus TaxID=151894 RepID=A0A1W2CVL4_9SPHI|nr:carboxypeptidase-like regulatory domain-containing protein [Pedobacter africanus]SMC89263.1 Carboxypeptidase regulatory-like domain-containing protein [Pedobacter africanus]
MKKYLLPTLIGFIIVVTACKKSGTQGEPGVVANAVTGKVTDSKGNPLANVEVTVENQMTGNHNTRTVLTSQNGTYKIELTSVGIFQASAYIKKNYNGVEYHMPLHPDNNELFNKEGAVRNFVWKLSGAMPDNTGFYGGTCELSPDIYIVPIEDFEKVEFTLTPVGPIIDGSNGTVIKINPVRVSSYFVIRDIPIGRYFATAAYGQGTNKISLQLKKRDSNDPYALSAIINFPGSISDPIAALSYKK